MASIVAEQMARYPLEERKLLAALAIARSSEGDVRREAATAVAALLVKGKNTRLYKDFRAEMFAVGIDLPLEENWALEQDKQAPRELDKLEVTLGTAKTELFKESVRIAYNNLTAFYLSRGDYANAVKSQLRSRDYCTTTSHVVQMCLQVAKISLNTQNYPYVAQYVGKADTVIRGDSNVSSGEWAQFFIAKALVELEKRNYRACATELLKAPFSIDACNEFSCAGDIVLMASLTALASFDREELKAKAIDNNVFKQYSELEPKVRELVTCFFECRYAQSLAALDSLRGRLTFDVYLSGHRHALLEAVRQKAISQYVRPFLTVDLSKMARAFCTTPPDLMREVVSLIVKGGIKGRIDKAQMVLYATQTNHRAKTFGQVVEAGETFATEVEDTIRRLSMARNDVVVKPAAIIARMQQHHHAAAMAL